MSDAPFDPTTNIGKLRALIPDRTPIVNLMKLGQVDYLFSDGDLQAYLDMNGGVIRRALADALETLGTNEMMVGKVITTQDLNTDTSKLMAQYLARAKTQRMLADQENGPIDNSQEGLFGVVITTQPWGPLGYVLSAADINQLEIL